MDPAVIAALIATPTAILAACTAYAAGRAQARGAHRGPVDAVRRQHQRDAYALFAKAARSFHASTHPTDVVAIEAAGEDPSRLSGARRKERARQLRRQADVKPLLDAYLVVELEGPKHVAGLAKRVVSHAENVRSNLPVGDIWRPASPWRPDHAALNNAVEAFVAAARDHLNGSRG
ncbi:hypothetical protein ACFW2D_17605 [Streptomyces sp. NPDC058914]|uniref:hypothetical protein n=1 Tax=Streptomyces sp. NPDC058914 TaxID=3346671 RepID=UPI00367DA86F